MFLVTDRRKLKKIPCGPDDKKMFKCYEWNTQIPLTPATPRTRLRCKIINLQNTTIDDLVAVNRRYCYDAKILGRPEVQDYIFALFWIAILRGRIKNDTFNQGWVARANIVVPGGHTHSRRYKTDYFGSETTLAVAQCHARNLIGDMGPEGTISESEYITRAAQSIRSSIQQINGKYMAKLNCFKESLSPNEDHEACNRAIQPNASNVFFEDWSSYGRGQEAGLSYVRGSRPSFFPDNDSMREGSVILLPRKFEPLVFEDWQICICLDGQDLDRVLETLDNEGWWNPGQV